MRACASRAGDEGPDTAGRARAGDEGPDVAGRERAGDEGADAAGRDRAGDEGANGQTRTSGRVGKRAGCFAVEFLLHHLYRRYARGS